MRDFFSTVPSSPSLAVAVAARVVVVGLLVVIRRATPPPARPRSPTDDARGVAIVPDARVEARM
jgi:hypothetical protein